MNMNTTPEQLRAIADIMEGNKPFEVRRFPDHQWQNPGFPIHWYIADNRIQAWEIRPKPLDFAPIPDGAERHNPDGLTPEQVGEGWRLTVEGEPVQSPDVAEFYNDLSTKWVAREYMNGRAYGRERTYRVPLSTPYPDGSRVVDGKLVKPWKLTREIPGFRPLRDGEEWHRTDWTEEMLPEGWRPLLKGESVHDGDEGNCNSATSPGLFRWAKHSFCIGISNPIGWSRTRRPLPDPAKVQLGPEDVPPGSAIRWPHCNWVMVSNVCDSYAVMSNGDRRHWKTLMDGGATIHRPGNFDANGKPVFQPCWKEGASS
jgi:hypothetical protein